MRGKSLTIALCQLSSNKPSASTDFQYLSRSLLAVSRRSSSRCYVFRAPSMPVTPLRYAIPHDQLDAGMWGRVPCHDIRVSR